MSRKFERLLDYLVNEDMEKANALFHEIVVEKSRNIYEDLMSTAMSENDDLYHEAFGGDPADDMVTDVVDPNMGVDDEDMDMDDMDMDDEVTDMDDADMGNEDFDTDTDMEDDISDIKNTLKELTDEFEALLEKIGQDDEFDDDVDDEDMGIDDEDMNDEDMNDEDMDNEDMDDEDMDDEFGDDDTEVVREYREVVKKNPLDSENESGAYTRSPINANPSDRPGGGKVTAKNIAQSHTGEKVSVAAAKGKFVDSNTLNVDGKTTKGYHSAKKSASKETGVNSKAIVPK